MTFIESQRTHDSNDHMKMSEHDVQQKHHPDLQFPLKLALPNNHYLNHMELCTHGSEPKKT